MRTHFRSLAFLAVASAPLFLTGCPGDDKDTDETGETGETGETEETDTDTDTEEPTVTYGVFVRGQLFTDDLVAAQGAHDAAAAGGEEAAIAAGDIAHDALTGSGLLGSTVAHDFLGIDRWNNLDGMNTFYSDPAFAEGFAALFNEDGPTVEFFVQQDEWHTWGSMEAGDASDQYWFVVARGHLAESDPATAKAAHDAVAAGGEEIVTAAGDVAHVVFTGLEDPQEFVAVDIWSSSDAIEATYTNPDFVAGFASLFDAQPTVQIYQSTTWHQWDVPPSAK